MFAVQIILVLGRLLALLHRKSRWVSQVHRISNRLFGKVLTNDYWLRIVNTP